MPSSLTLPPLAPPNNINNSSNVVGSSTRPSLHSQRSMRRLTGRNGLRQSILERQCSLSRIETNFLTDLADSGSEHDVQTALKTLENSKWFETTATTNTTAAPSPPPPPPPSPVAAVVVNKCPAGIAFPQRRPSGPTATAPALPTTTRIISMGSPRRLERLSVRKRASTIQIRRSMAASNHSRRKSSACSSSNSSSRGFGSGSNNNINNNNHASAATAAQSNTSFVQDSRAFATFLEEFDYSDDDDDDDEKVKDQIQKKDKIVEKHEKESMTIIVEKENKSTNDHDNVSTPTTTTATTSPATTPTTTIDNSDIEKTQADTALPKEEEKKEIEEASESSCNVEGPSLCPALPCDNDIVNLVRDLSFDSILFHESSASDPMETYQKSRIQNNNKSSVDWSFQSLPGWFRSISMGHVVSEKDEKPSMTSCSCTSHTSITTNDSDHDDTIDGINANNEKQVRFNQDAAAPTVATNNSNLLDGDDNNYNNNNVDDSMSFFPDAPITILGADSWNVQPMVLTPTMMQSFQPHLPFTKRGESFWLQYSMVRDGACAHSMLQQVRGSKYCLLAIETVEGEVFGAFTSEPWSISPRFYGSSDTFVWKRQKPRTDRDDDEHFQQEIQNDKELDVYKYTFMNRNLQLCQSDKIAVGGGMPGGSISSFDDSFSSSSSSLCKSNNNNNFGIKDTAYGFAICLDGESLLDGTSSPCLTFDSPSLSTCHYNGSQFEVVNLEIWTLTPCLTLEEAEKMAMGRLFLQRHQTF